MADYVVSHFNYWVFIVLMMLGLYIVFASGNMVKRLIGLGVFQTSVFLFYISMGKVTGGVPPILPESHGGEGEHAEAAHAAASGATAHPALRGDSDAVTLAGGASDVGEAGMGAAHDTAVDGAGVIPLETHTESLSDHASDGLHFAASALDQTYSNPLPHVLILTAIVVGVATLAVGLALVVLIREAYGTIEDDDISRAEYDAEVAGADA